MKEIPWSEFRLQKVSDVKTGQCLKVTGDGAVAFYVVVHPQGEMIAKIEGLCGMIDASRGLN